MSEMRLDNVWSIPCCFTEKRAGLEIRLLYFSHNQTHLQETLKNLESLIGAKGHFELVYMPPEDLTLDAEVDSPI